jgi:hypothetical protein
MSNLRVAELNNTQYGLWDTFVDQSPQGDVFCYSWWLDSITKSNFKILVIFDGDEIVAGIPLAFDSQNKINIPPLTRTLGVLYKSQDTQNLRKQASLRRKWLTGLLNHISPDDFVQICTHHNFNDWLPFRWKGYSQTTRYTYIIDYHNSSDLWNNLDELRKRTITRALKSGIRIEVSDDFDLLYKFVSLTYERQDLSLRIPYEEWKKLDAVIKKKNNRVILKAVDTANNVHAVIYIVANKKSAYYILSGSDPKLRKLGGHTLVLWEAVKYFSDKVQFFNFGGSDIERIENHIRGYGGTLTPYFHIYNENMVGNGISLRHHLNETTFHTGAILKIIKTRLSGLFSHK